MFEVKITDKQNNLSEQKEYRGIIQRDNGNLYGSILEESTGREYDAQLTLDSETGDGEKLYLEASNPSESISIDLERVSFDPNKALSEKPNSISEEDIDSPQGMYSNGQSVMTVERISIGPFTAREENQDQKESVP